MLVLLLLFCGLLKNEKNEWNSTKENLGLDCMLFMSDLVGLRLTCSMSCVLAASHARGRLAGVSGIRNRGKLIFSWGRQSFQRLVTNHSIPQDNRLLGKGANEKQAVTEVGVPSYTSGANT
jgi:hypothetical protein